MTWHALPVSGSTRVLTAVPGQSGVSPILRVTAVPGAPRTSASTAPRTSAAVPVGMNFIRGSAACIQPPQALGTLSPTMALGCTRTPPRLALKWYTVWP